MERITAASGRINVPELKNDTPNVTGGYILEWDYRKDADHNVTAGGRGWVDIKEPEDESDGSGITGAQIKYIRTSRSGTSRSTSATLRW